MQQEIKGVDFHRILVVCCIRLYKPMINKMGRDFGEKNEDDDNLDILYERYLKF